MAAASKPPLLIDVTQADIDKGGRGGGNCPIYHAVKRQYPNTDVWVSMSSIRVGYYIYPDQLAFYHLTEEAISFISDYDHSKPVKPFSFKAPEYGR